MSRQTEAMLILKPTFCDRVSKDCARLRDWQKRHCPRSLTCVRTLVKLCVRMHESMPLLPCRTAVALSWNLEVST
jgi:hypothetical protein